MFTLRGRLSRISVICMYHTFIGCNRKKDQSEQQMTHSCPTRNGLELSWVAPLLSSFILPGKKTMLTYIQYNYTYCGLIFKAMYTLLLISFSVMPLLKLHIWRNSQSRSKRKYSKHFSALHRFEKKLLTWEIQVRIAIILYVYRKPKLQCLLCNTFPKS